MNDSIDSSKATDWREGRRLRAFELKQEGWSQQNIARALGVGKKSAVSQWMKRAREGGGKEALRKRSSPGAPRLSPDQRERLPGLLKKGAVAHGFRGEVWTCKRVAKVIKREFGVAYHPAHVRAESLRGWASPCRSPIVWPTSEMRMPSKSGRRSAGRS